MDVALNPTTLTFDDAVVIHGEKPLVDVEEAKTGSTLTAKEIELQPVRQIQSVVNMQTGVVQSADGVHIRGEEVMKRDFISTMFLLVIH